MQNRNQWNSNQKRNDSSSRANQSNPSGQSSSHPNDYETNSSFDQNRSSSFEDRNFSRSNDSDYPFGTSSSQYGTQDRSPSWDRPNESFKGQDYRTFNDYSGSNYSGNHGTRGLYESNSQERGLHTGKGPKGYRRSDERIQEEVCDALQFDPQVDATDIDVKVESGVVTLTGDVEDRAMKRRAEDCVERSRGVNDVQNNLKVKNANLWDKITGQESDTPKDTTKTKSASSRLQ